MSWLLFWSRLYDEVHVMWSIVALYIVLIINRETFQTKSRRSYTEPTQQSAKRSMTINNMPIWPNAWRPPSFHFAFEYSFFLPTWNSTAWIWVSNCSVCVWVYNIYYLVSASLHFVYIYKYSSFSFFFNGIFKQTSIKVNR